jgi:hypothetical protein
MAPAKIQPVNAVAVIPTQVALHVDPDRPLAHLCGNLAKLCGDVVRTESAGVAAGDQRRLRPVLAFDTLPAGTVEQHRVIDYAAAEQLLDEFAVCVIMLRNECRLRMSVEQLRQDIQVHWVVPLIEVQLDTTVTLRYVLKQVEFNRVSSEQVCHTFATYMQRDAHWLR